MKVYILRGLPGSGKSTWIENALDDSGVQPYVCSADHFHTGEDGVYRFDPKNIKKAHEECLRKFMLNLYGSDKPDFLIVDNTNCSAWEISPYYRLTELYGHEVKILTFWCSPELSMKRNTHNVPATTILSMYQRLLTEVLPPHWNHEIILSKRSNGQ